VGPWSELLHLLPLWEVFDAIEQGSVLERLVLWQWAGIDGTKASPNLNCESISSAFIIEDFNRGDGAGTVFREECVVAHQSSLFGPGRVQAPPEPLRSTGSSCGRSRMNQLIKKRTLCDTDPISTV
jgi:hypothetical protein